MKKTDAYSEKAGDFLKQWQDQMSRQMRDPDVIRTLLAAMQSFGVPPHDENARQPAAAPDARDDAIRAMAKRLDAVERQLAQLLSVAAKAKKPARTAQRRSAKPVATVKRTVAKRKPGVAKKPKPAPKRR